MYNKVSVLCGRVLITSILILLLAFCDCESNKEENKVFVHSYFAFTYLATSERSIYDELKDFNSDLISNTSLLSILDKYKDDYLQYKGILASEADQNLLASHPLLAYRLIHRYVNYLHPLLQHIKTLSPNIEREDISLQNTIGWPTKSDVEHAMRGIFRLQHVYDLNINEFVTLNASVAEPSFYVQPYHCYSLGNYAIQEGYFSIGIEWLEIGISLVKASKGSKSLKLVSRHAFKKSLSEGITVHNSEWDKMPDSRYDSELYTRKLSVDDTDMETGKREKRRTYLLNYYRGERDERFKEINFWGLCSGIDMRTDLEKSKLFCWLDSKSNPYWAIGPLKIEELAKNPRILQIYDAIPSTWIDTLIEESEQKLQQSLSSSFGQNYLSKQRTSLQHWLVEEETKGVELLPKRIELITGLVTTEKNSSEKLQVAAYTFGNHFDVHRDVISSQIKSTEKDRRIATFMIYLSEVEKGGYTAFPQGGVAAIPVKGSAVFWFNLKHNGDIDEATWHGGCPVIGQKWVANKWIQSHAQFRTRPCSLDPTL